MLTTLSLFFSAYSKAVAANPILAGFALWATAIVSYLARNVPVALWRWFTGAITTTVEMNNAGYSGNEFHFTLFLTWFMESPWSKWSRSLYTGRSYVPQSGGEETVMGPGYGLHFFFYEGRFFWFRKTGLDSAGSERVKDKIRITTFGRSHAPLLNLVKAFEYKKKDDEVEVFEFHSNNGWQRVAAIAKRPLNTLFIDEEIKAKLLHTHDHFVNNQQWYLERGIAYKISTLLFGKPGTGKTSIVKVLASYYNRSIYLLDLASLSNKTLQYALASLPPKAILLMEDVDAASSVVDTRENGDKAANESMLLDIAQPLTLAGLLNALDGIIPLHDVMVFLSTNHREKLDPALIRKSRVDYEYEIGPMGNEEIHAYVSLMYPNERVHPGTVFLPMVGCDVQAAFRETPDSLVGFLRQLFILERTA